MPFDKETKDFIVNSNKIIYEDIIEKINSGVIGPLQENTQHFLKRFDDIEKRLESIEGRLNIMNKHTEIIPNIFELLETDGEDIAKLTARVDKIGTN